MSLVKFVTVWTGLAWILAAGPGAAVAMERHAASAPRTATAEGADAIAAESRLARRQQLHAVWGRGSGEAIVVPFEDDTPDFSARIRVTLERAKPDTVYVIQRAPELGRNATTDRDGRCQRAFALPPWSATDAPAPSFVTFVAVDEQGTPLPDGPILLRTNRGGFGRASFEFHTPPGARLVSGTSFDVIFRVLDDLANPASVLLGECVTVFVP